MREVVVSETARSELRNITAYLSCFGSATAHSFAREFERKVSSLRDGFVEYPHARHPKLAAASNTQASQSTGAGEQHAQEPTGQGSPAESVEEPDGDIESPAPQGNQPAEEHATSPADAATLATLMLNPATIPLCLFPGPQLFPNAPNWAAAIILTALQASALELLLGPITNTLARTLRNANERP